MSTILTFLKKNRLVIIVDIVLITLYLIVTSIAHNKAVSLYSQQEAARWENEDVVNVSKKDSSDSDASGKKRFKLSKLAGEKKMPYAQVSAFISPGRGLDSDGLNSVRSSLQEKLMKDSYGESQSGGRIWIDAYSCESNINLRKDSNTLSVTAVGVGGEFFQFHPMTLLSGSYISDSDLNHDRIVVDENFAWAMFGSNDIVGMQVWLGEGIYYISGVVKVDEDNISQMAYGNGNRVYMSYAELKKVSESLPITCYEAVLPNPISNYASNALKSAFGLSDESDEQLDKKENPLSFDDVEVIENTKRYETMELITKLKHWRLRSMRASSVGYPFWENIARVQDDTQMVLLLLRFVLLICPIISLVWLLYGLWELKTWTIKGLLLQEIEQARERRIIKAYEAKMAAEENESEDSREEDDISNVEVEYTDEQVDDISDVESEDSDEQTDDIDDEYVQEKDNDESVEDEDPIDDSIIEEEEEQIELRSVTGNDLF